MQPSTIRFATSFVAITIFFYLNNLVDTTNGVVLATLSPPKIISPSPKHNKIQPQPPPSPMITTTAKLIDTFLLKCVHSISIDLDCQPCSLCQNGAFCQQKPPTINNKPTFTELVRSHLLSHRQLSEAQHMNQIRPKLDLTELTCYCVPGYTGRNNIRK